MLWERRESSKWKGHFYLYNRETGESKWEGDIFENKEQQQLQQGEEEKVQVLHLLVKHSLSRRPSSWRDEVISRSEEEALQRINALREEIISKSAKASSGSMEDVFRRCCTTESDCSSARNGGDLGTFGRGKMQKVFEDEAFSLGVNQLSSEAIKTDSGLHIVYRIL